MRRNFPEAPTHLVAVRVHRAANTVPMDTSFDFGTYDFNYPRRVEIFLGDAIRLVDLSGGPGLLCRLEVANRVSTLALHAGEKPMAWVRLDGHPDNRWRSCTPPVDELLKPISVLLEEWERTRKGLVRAFKAMVGGKYAPRRTVIPPDRDFLRRKADRAVRKWIRANRINPTTVEACKRAASVKRSMRRFLQEMAARPEPCRAHWSHPNFAMVMQSHQGLRVIEPWLESFDPNGLAFVESRGFREGRWQLMNLWMRAPQYRRCITEHPVLAWLFACAWHARNSPWTNGKPRHSPHVTPASTQPYAMMKWLNLPSSDDTLCILNRWPCKDLRVRRWHGLLAVLRSPLAHILMRGNIVDWDGDMLELLAKGNFQKACR